MHFGENQLSPLSIGISPLPTGHPSLLQQTPVRPSMPCYGHFSLPMGSSSGFGSTRRDARPIQTCFRCGSAYDWLNRPQRVTRRIILQKARRQPVLAHLGLRLHGSVRFQGLFHSPRRGTFHRSLTVLCAIGRCVYVALGGGPPSFTPDCSCPALLKSHTSVVVAVGYPAVTVCGDAFQTSSPSNSDPTDGWPSVVRGLPTP